MITVEEKLVLQPPLVTVERHESNARSYVRRFPITVASAEGVFVVDDRGRQYLDFLACAGTLALGHNHPVIVAAIRDFLASKAPLQSLDLCTVWKDRFINSLLSVLPPELQRLHFCSPSGTDAVDAAIKLCKSATGRSTVVAFHGAYHGMGIGPLALMGNVTTKAPVGGLMPDVHFFPFPSQIDSACGDGADGEQRALSYIERVLCDPEGGICKPACMILEPIQGEGGVNELSPNALREIRRITKEQGIPLIVDEVQCGFCRSGDFFAFQRSGIVPDVICMSKAIGGSMPMAVIAFREELNTWAPGAHTGTFRGNGLAFACGIASLDFMRTQELWKTAARRGEQMHARLAGMGLLVKGRGMMLGAEIPNDKTGTRARAVAEECFRRGLILERGGRHGRVLRLLPPLIATEAEISAAMDILQASLTLSSL